ncbi:MAG: hypothetical protein JO061_23040, partial [Acidobacteriaceae bacterium]|nr:hypothetical protein [Acidobacteriaceae bacterium]
MANLFFPQLLSGAVAQYPLRKTHQTRTVTNVLADGSMITFADPTAAKRIWQLTYSELTSADIGSLQQHFV